MKNKHQLINFSKSYFSGKDIVKIIRTFPGLEKFSFGRLTHLKCARMILPSSKYLLRQRKCYTQIDLLIVVIIMQLRQLGIMNQRFGLSDRLIRNALKVAINRGADYVCFTDKTGSIKLTYDLCIPLIRLRALGIGFDGFCGEGTKRNDSEEWTVKAA